MPDDIRPIETSYNGYRFRSRLEARWAVFWDAIGIWYEYEKEGFDLGAEGYYLPDFWLPGHSLWVEIKGQTPTDLERRKCLRLAEMGNPVYLIYGNIGEHDAFAYARTPSGEVIEAQFSGVWGAGGRHRYGITEARRARFEWKIAEYQHEVHNG